MEFIVIFLSAFLTGITPTGFILDNVIESNLRSRLAGVDTLEVRIDNTPSHQILQGKVDRVRLATRGLFLTPEIRLDTLELETDPLSVDIKKLRQDSKNWRAAFRQPVQGAVRLVLTEADLNQALQSPQMRDRLQGVINRVAANLPGSESQTYELSNLELDFLPENRLRLKLAARSLDLTGQESAELSLEITAGLTLEGGKRIRLNDPTVLLNENPLPPMFAGIAISALNERLNLDPLSRQGITARLLQLEVEEEALNLAAFVRIDPASPQ